MSVDVKTALARPGRQGRHNHLGLDLVNHDRESFFLYAEPFLCMMRRQDEYVIVKHRDSDPEKAISHHGGAIWGDVECADSVMTITLYFGALYKDIVYVPDGGDLLHVIGDQQYRIPADWLMSIAAHIERVRNEQREFELLKMEANVTPLQASFFK